MANNRIKGLTIEIGGDTSKLDKALKGTNQNIKDTQTALKDVEKLLKLDPTNTELLAQKQSLLSNRVTETKGKLETLKKAEEQLKASGIDQNSEQFLGLRREIIDTEASLKTCTKEAQSFNAGLAQVSGTLGKVSAGAQTVADKTKALSAAAAGVVAGIGAMAVKAMTAADDLNTLAKQSGLTTAEIQKMQYAADLVDVSSDDIISALRKLKKNMASTSSSVTDAWAKLGISVKDANGEFRDSSEVFYETLEALSRVGNETERDVLAMDLFGKSADDLAGIIDDGGQKLKELGDQAERAGLIMSQESIDAANNINDMVDALKADVSQTILITGAKALEALQPVIEKVIEAVSNLLTIIGEMDPTTIQLILTIAAAVAAISPIAGIIATITSAISGVIAILPLLTPIITAVTAAAPWVALGVVIAALVALIVKHWDEIKAAGAAFVDWIKTNVVEPWNSFWQGVADRWNEIWENITDRVKSNVNMIVDFINSAIEAINSLIQKINDSAVGKALGFNIGTVNTIPGLASGGTVGNGGAALVGEAGAELLTVNNGRATVTPMTQNIYNYAADGDRTPLRITIPLSINGKQFARAVYDDMSSEGIRRGSTMGAIV